MFAFFSASSFQYGCCGDRNAFRAAVESDHLPLVFVRASVPRGQLRFKRLLSSLPSGSRTPLSSTAYLEVRCTLAVAVPILLSYSMTPTNRVIFQTLGAFVGTGFDDDDDSALRSVCRPTSGPNNQRKRDDTKRHSQISVRN